MEIADSLGAEIDTVGWLKALTYFLQVFVLGGLLPLGQFILEWSHWLVPGNSHYHPMALPHPNSTLRVVRPAFPLKVAMESFQEFG